MSVLRAPKAVLSLAASNADLCGCGPDQDSTCSRTVRPSMVAPCNRLERGFVTSISQCHPDDTCCISGRMFTQTEQQHDRGWALRRQGVLQDLLGPTEARSYPLRRSLRLSPHRGRDGIPRTDPATHHHPPQHVVPSPSELPGLDGPASLVTQLHRVASARNDGPRLGRATLSVRGRCFVGVYLEPTLTSWRVAAYLR